MTAQLLHPDSVLLITLDSCRYDSFRRSTTPAMDRVGPLHRAMAPSHFTFGSHSAIFKGFTSVLKIWPLLVVFIILTQLILPEYPQQDRVRELKDVGGPLFYEMFLYAGLVFPVLEELIFRGLLYPILKKHIGAFWGCVTSSLLFSSSSLSLSRSALGSDCAWTAAASMKANSSVEI